MATTAQNMALAPELVPPTVITVSASANAVMTRGDWIFASAQVGTNVFLAGAHRISALGVALENNPTYTPIGGVATNNSAFSVLTMGIARVSAGNSGTARTIPLGSFVYCNATASGIVGQTAATGVGPTWITAPVVGISASIGALTATVPSGVARVINHPVGGDSGVGQIDIYWNLATNVPYF